MKKKLVPLAGMAAGVAVGSAVAQNLRVPLGWVGSIAVGMAASIAVALIAMLVAGKLMDKKK